MASPRARLPHPRPRRVLRPRCHQAFCRRGRTSSPDGVTLTLAERTCGETDRRDPRECIDHVVILGEAHLRRILAAYAGYYNELRTHLSLDEDAPRIHGELLKIGIEVARSTVADLEDLSAP
jgi:hypothetical protein